MYYKLKVDEFAPSCPEHFRVEQHYDSANGLVWKVTVKSLRKKYVNDIVLWDTFSEIGRAFDEGIHRAQTEHFYAAEKGGCKDERCLWCAEFSPKIIENTRREKEWFRKQNAKWNKTKEKFKKENITKPFNDNVGFWAPLKPLKVEE